MIISISASVISANPRSSTIFNSLSIFFLAFLPQFADPARGSLTLQMLLLGGAFIGSTVFIFGGIAMMAGTIGGWLNRSPKTQVVMNRVAGTVFVALALKLATTTR